MARRTQPKNRSGASYKIGFLPPDLLTLWISVAVLFIVPLAMSRSVYRIFVLPKFAVLLVGAAAVAVCISLIGVSRGSHAFSSLKSRHALLVLLFVCSMVLSTVFGVLPVSQFFGSSTIQAGLLTYLCFATVFIGLTVGVGSDGQRLRVVVWVMSVTGLITAAYAILQFVGKDPFLSSSLYTADSGRGAVVRVPGTLGHADLLGNFLLYTTPVTAALAVSSRSRTRRIATLMTLLSLAAIVFAGTRGAWLGITSAISVFVALSFRGRLSQRGHFRRATLLKSAVIVFLIGAGVVIFVLSPVSRSIAIRARSFWSDKFTGSGRTLLWRDSLQMIPERVVIGVGPEGFTRAFPRYKSVELAQYAPQNAQESSHNSYMDAVINFGLVGGVLYVAIIASAFSLFFKSLASAADQEMKSLIVGLISAGLGVCVHNFFLYDQLSTGLYFFALLALALIVRNVTRPIGRAVVNSEAGSGRWPWKAAFALSCIVMIAAVWFAASELAADNAAKSALMAARNRNLTLLKENADLAIRSNNPTRAYDEVFGRAIVEYVASLPRSAKSRRVEIAAGRLTADEAELVRLGIEHLSRAAERSLFPASDYVLMANLAKSINDLDRTLEFARQAAEYDPHCFPANMLLSKASLFQNNREAVAKKLGPMPMGSSALASGRSAPDDVSPRVLAKLERARFLADRGLTNKATMLLKRGIELSHDRCAPCRQELAKLYEAQGLIPEAIEEWRAYSRIAPARASEEHVQERIQRLSGANK